MATLKHGFLEKESKGYITSKWSMRWCVLTKDSLTFYSDQSLTIKKGIFPIHYYTTITKKDNDNNRKYQLLLTDSIKKEELTLSASDLTTFTSWEEAISKVISSQSKPMLQGERRSAVDISLREGFSERQQHSSSFSINMNMGSISSNNNNSISNNNNNNQQHQHQIQVLQQQLRDDSYDEPTIHTMSIDLQAIIGKTVDVVRSGFMQKQGHIVQSWKKRWFVLSSSSLYYFTNEKMNDLKGTININEFSHICHEKSNSNDKLFPLSLWTIDENNIGVGIGIGTSGTRTVLLMNASDEVSALQWEAAFTSVILKHKHIKHPIAVRVSIVTDFDIFPVITIDQVYIIQLFIESECVSKAYFHYSDIKDIYTNLHQVTSSNVTFNIQFPRSYKRVDFGIQLRSEEIEGRRYQLECWLQELIEKYHEFDYLNTFEMTSTSSSNGNEIQNDIASLFGCTTIELSLHIDSFFKGDNYNNYNDDDDDNDNDNEVKVELLSNEVEDISKLRIENYTQPTITTSTSTNTKSTLSKLFETTNQSTNITTPSSSSSPSVLKATTTITTTNTTTTTNDNHIETRPREKSDVNGEEENRTSLSSNILIMPDDPNELKTYSFMKLAELCKLKNIDCRNFKSKKNYYKALIETYKQQLPYLHGKDPYIEIKRITKLVEAKKGQPLDPQLVIEIDSIFIDLMRKLNVLESIIPTLNVKYQTLEKFSEIIKCISIWNKYGDFIEEDSLVIKNLNNDSTIDGFHLLLIKSKISTSNAGNEWLHRFCVHNGIFVLVSVMNKLLEQNPISDIDAANLLIIIQSFRFIMEKDCRDVLIETTGSFDVIVRSLIFQFKPLALEVIELLAECILYGGSDAPWLIISSFKRLSKKLNKKPFQIFVDGINSDDITIQSGIINLINSLMLYEPKLEEKLDFRMNLLVIDFENVCRKYIREHQKLLLGKKNNTNDNENGNNGNSQSELDQQNQQQQHNLLDENDENNIYLQRTQTRRLRAGIKINDFDMNETVAEDGLTIISPTEGIMEGYAIEILEKEEEEKMFTPAPPIHTTNTKNRSASLIGFPSNNYLNVAPSVFGFGKFTRRLSTTNVPLQKKKSITTIASPSTEIIRDTISARRLWYKINIQDKLLLWYFSVDDSRDDFTYNNNNNNNNSDNENHSTIVGQMSFFHIKDIIDYSTFASRLNFNLQNCISIITEEIIGEIKLYHMCFDSLETKHRWLVALNYVRKLIQLIKSPYRLPLNVPLKSSVILRLRKNFERHVSLYRNLCNDDSSMIYMTIIKDFLSGLEITMNPIDLSNFLYYELKIHRNEGKFLHLLKDITIYVSSNYAPRPNDDENEFNGNKYPIAVKSSNNIIPKPPPLPPLPEPKLKIKPGAKVKQLFWTKVKPINVRNTIWMNINEPELNWKYLDLNFSATTNGRRGGIALKTRESISTSKKIYISLFDSRRTQNVAIATGKLKKSPEELYEIILSMDPEELTIEITDTILNLLIPTVEEVAIIKGYICNNGNIQDLDYCGKLFAYFLEIEGLESRLLLQRIMLTWFDQIEVIEDQLITIKQSIEELNELEALNSLQIILSIILAIGNYLNGSTPRGQAHGYRLEILLKLKNMKQTTQSRRNLLHYIIDEMRRVYPNILPFYDSWKSMWYASKYSKQVITTMIEEVGILLNKCTEEIEIVKNIENERVKTSLMNRLSLFITAASDKFKDICNLFELTDISVQSIKRFLGETILGCTSSDTNSTDEDPWQTFFHLITKFAEMYKISILEIEEWNKNELKSSQKNNNNNDNNKNKISVSKIEISQFSKETLKQVHQIDKLNNHNHNQSKGSNHNNNSNNNNNNNNVMEIFKERMEIIRKRNSTNLDDSDHSDNDKSEW